MNELATRIARLSPVKRELLALRLRAEATPAGEAEPGADARIVGYVLPRSPSRPDERELRAYLRERLPEYMVPAAVIVLDKLPVRPSGKLDLNALPDPVADRDRPRDRPRTSTEELLCGIWCDVLGARAIGVHESFFDVGGHSLLMVRVASRAREIFGIDIPLRWMFEASSVAELAARIEDAKGAGARSAPEPIVSVPRSGALPLSSEQRALWLTEQIDPGGAAYAMPAALRARGRLDVAALEQALNELRIRHEALRTTFAICDGEPSQIVQPHRPEPLPVVSLDDRAEDERERALLAILDEEARLPFDLAEGPVFRARLIRLAEADHVLLTSMHHIVCDGWSTAILNREMAELYEAFAAGNPSPLPAPALGYADYAAWQRGRAYEDAIGRQLAYWQGRLAGGLFALDVPADRPRPATRSTVGALYRTRVPLELVERLRTLGRHGATLFMTLVAAFKALLHRWTHEEDLLVGTPIAGRGRRDLEDVVGYFVNAVALRTDLSGDPTFLELLARVRETALSAYANQHVPFERVVSAVQRERDPSRTPIFQVLCELQSMPPSPPRLEGLEVTVLEPETRTAKFDLLLIFTEAPDGLVATFEYSTALFDRATVVRMAAHLDAVLRAVAADPGTRLSRLPLLSAAERRELLAERNRTDNEWDAGDCFPALFAAQARRTPGATAVVSDERSLTYAELRARAGALARSLRGAGLGDEDRVGVLLDRDIELLIALLGILEAGLAYVPLDPGLPQARLGTMAALAGCRLLLTDPAHHATAAALAAPGVAVVDIDAALAGEPPRQDEPRAVNPRGLAYVIFTSGSTGTPKGAMIEHRGMLNHLRAKVAALGCSAADCIAEAARQSFDVSVWQFLTALLVGGRVTILKDESAWEPRRLLAHLARDRATVFETVPSHAVAILDELERAVDRVDLSALRWLILNGEPLLPELCARWFRLYPDVPMINAYGPTECSDDVAHYVMRSAPSRPWRYVPISGTLPNLRVYVLDRHLEPAPVGVAGELWIGGAGVGRGYIGDPARTAAAFLPDPFSEAPGARLYRTGDSVRILADGSIEFLGRIDQQVKIRGYRIELGEIEVAIADHPRVRECVVVALRDAGGEARLVAYAVPREPGLTVQELRDHLRGGLAAYMLPTAIVFLGALPLLPNGKIDRKRLPAPADDDTSRRDDRVAPRTPTERLVASVWSELLSVASVGAHDDFFELGGHSLIAIRTLSRVRSLTGVQLSVRTLFERATVAEVAAAIDERRGLRARAALPGEARSAGMLELGAVVDRAVAAAEATAHRALSPYQLPAWYMHELEPASPFYNVTSSDLELVGDLDVPTFARVWQTLIERHAVFRTVFDYIDYRPVQRLVPAPAIDVADLYLDRREIPEDALPEERRRIARAIGDAPFDFAAGPLFRIKLAEFSGKRFQIFFAVHHIVWDETSTMNLAREMAALYNAYRAGREPALPELALQYPDFAHASQRAIDGGAFEQQRQYWRARLSPPPPALDLPVDFARPAVQTFEGDTVSEWIDPELGAKIDETVRRHQITLNIFFLSVLNLELHRLSEQRDFVIGMPIANRNDERLEPLLGLFATALPMRCTIADGWTFADLLRETRKSALEAYDNHQYPSILAIQEANPDVDFSRSRLFSVMFGVQNNKTRLLDELAFDGLEVRVLADAAVAEFETSKFDLTVVVDQLDDRRVVHFNFNTSLFRPSTARRMLRQLLSLAEQVIADPERPLGDYRLMSAEEERRIVEGFNATGVDVDLATAIHARIEHQAARAPDAVAIVHDRRRLTYRELDAAANRLAHHLAALGAGPEQRIAVLLDPSAALVTALLAVFRSGAAYVPIVPDAPAERRNHVIARSGARILVTTSAVLRDEPAPCEAVVRLDAEADRIALMSAAPLGRSVASSSLAYVIFTSGTTGVPKGIEIEHGGIVNLIESTQRDYALGPDDRVLWLTPFDFDASVLDLFWPLSAGAAIVIPKETTARHPARLGEAIEEHGVTVFQCVPLQLEALVEVKSAGRTGALDRLRLVICGGAALSRGLRDRFRALFAARLANHYGPTEVTVDAARFDCSDEVTGDVVPIGRPIANARIYVLDAALRPVPIGVTGAIHVASPGLARGYVGDPSRTAAQFVRDPFVAAPGARMYRTGDLGRLREDGVVEFVGRVDKQVKIRGNRVEIEEIEHHLLEHPAVARAVVQLLRRGGAAEELVTHVELRDEILAFAEDARGLRPFTLAQRPELHRACQALHADAWPAYFAGDRTLRSYWSRLPEAFPECQFALVDAADEVVAVGNAVPIAWDGTVENLPAGWDAGLEQAFVDAERGIAPNTFLILTGVVAARASGRGLSTAILRAHKCLARALDYARVLVAVRPTTRPAEPIDDFAAWSLRRRADRQLEDGWLRAHERVGGRVLRVELRSQHIRASVAEWEKWAGRTFPSSGWYPLPDGLQQVRIDLEGDYGEYHDPSVWVDHTPRGDEPCAYRHVGVEELREWLRRRVPEYMVPAHFRVVGRMPLTSSGKIDEGALAHTLLTTARARPIPPQNGIERRLAEIWAEVLGVPSVGVTDDFFELGGHSIRAVEMLAKVVDAFQVEIVLRELFKLRTVRRLGRAVLAAVDAASAAALTRVSASASSADVALRPAAGTATAHHGEILQGVVEAGGRLHRALVTLPCGILHAEATFTPDRSGAVAVEPRWKVKARAAAELALAWADRSNWGGRLEIRSNVPVGWGLGSSTSDVIAAIRAVVAAAQKPIPPEAVARLSVQAETASDALMFSNRAVLFAQREGVVIEDLGRALPPLDVLGFSADPRGAGVDTLAQPLARYSSTDIEAFRVMRGLLRRAVRDQDPRLLGRVATASARISQRHLPKPRMDRIEAIAEASGAVGVQVAHSGTVVGLLFDPADAGVEQRVSRAKAALATLGFAATWYFRTPAQ